MDDADLALYVKGVQLRELEELKVVRWQTALMMTPHYKSGIRPTQLLKLEGDPTEEEEKLIEMGNQEFAKWLEE